MKFSFTLIKPEKLKGFNKISSFAKESLVSSNIFYVCVWYVKSSFNEFKLLNDIICILFDNKNPKKLFWNYYLIFTKAKFFEIIELENSFIGKNGYFPFFTFFFLFGIEK